MEWAEGRSRFAHRWAATTIKTAKLGLSGKPAQLGEDAHRYANRIGAPVFAFLRTVVMNLLRHGGYRSIRHGLRELAYDIKGILALAA